MEREREREKRVGKTTARLCCADCFVGEELTWLSARRAERRKTHTHRTTSCGSSKWSASISAVVDKKMRK